MTHSHVMRANCIGHRPRAGKAKEPRTHHKAIGDHRGEHHNSPPQATPPPTQPHPDQISWPSRYAAQRRPVADYSIARSGGGASRASARSTCGRRMAPKRASILPWMHRCYRRGILWPRCRRGSVEPLTSGTLQRLIGGGRVVDVTVRGMSLVVAQAHRQPDERDEEDDV